MGNALSQRCAYCDLQIYTSYTYTFPQLHTPSTTLQGQRFRLCFIFDHLSPRVRYDFLRTNTYVPSGMRSSLTYKVITVAVRYNKLSRSCGDCLQSIWTCLYITGSPVDFLIRLILNNPNLCDYQSLDDKQHDDIIYATFGDRLYLASLREMPRVRC